jgi:hypothetical protein
MSRFENCSHPKKFKLEKYLDLEIVEIEKLFELQKSLKIIHIYELFTFKKCSKI